MIRYCENAKYAHSIVKASIRLPRSCRCDGRTMALNGGRRDSQTTTHQLAEEINRIERAFKAQFPEVRWSFIEPDHAD